MAEHSLGKVTTASTTTGARATSNQTTPTARYPCQGYTAQAISTNTGSVFLCDQATPNLSTGVGVLWEVPAPTAGSNERPLLSVENPLAPADFDLSQVYVLPTVSNEGLRITAIKT